MGETIKIVLEGVDQASGAINKVKKELEDVGAATPAVGKAGAEATKAIEKGAAAAAAESEKLGRHIMNNRMALMELEHTARSTADILLMSGTNPRMLFAQIPQILQGLSMAGISLTTVATALGAVTAAAGAGYAIWREYTSAERDAARAADDLHAKLTGIAAAWKEIAVARAAGVIGGKEQNIYEGMLTGAIPVYRSKGGAFVLGRLGQAAPTEQVTMPAGGPGSPEDLASMARYFGLSQSFSSSAQKMVTKTVPMSQLSVQEVLNHIHDILNSPGFMDALKMKAMAEMKDLGDQVREKFMTPQEKAIKDIQDKYEALRKKIVATAAAAGEQILHGLPTDQKTLTIYDQTRIAQANEIAAIKTKYADEEAARLAAADQKAKARDAATVRRMEERRNKELAGLEQVDQLKAQIYLQSLTGINKEIAAINQRYDQEEKRLREFYRQKMISEVEYQAWLKLAEKGRHNEIGKALSKPKPGGKQGGYVGSLATEITSGSKAAIAILQSLNAEMLTLSGTIADAAYGVANWGQAWENLGRQAINSLVQVTAQYIAAKTAMMIIDEVVSDKKMKKDAQTAITGHMAGLGTAGSEGGWVGLLIYVAVLAAAMAAVTAAVQAASGGFAEGGPIRGPGGPTSDSVPIMASDGEFMMRAAAADYYGHDVMHAMNNMQVPVGVLDSYHAPASVTATRAFASGGPIIAPAAAQNVSVKPSDMHFYFLRSRQEILDAMASHEGRKITIGHVRGARTEIGIHA